MKRDTHPEYQDVLFVDSSTGHKFVIGSTLKSEEKEVFEGKEYPVCRVSISSASHPFFTGAEGLIDTEGRIDKFKKRYAAKQQAAPVEEELPEKKEKAKKAPAKKAKKKK